MKELERLQILTEIIREFKTAILMDREPDQTGRVVLEVIQEAGDAVLADNVLNAYLRLTEPDVAVSYLDKATVYLHGKIDVCLN
ncbi:hypothetical protein EV207_108124 [Scopulibacillus darangshiensis]|uniref:Uncharacterized protein n=1 Tax=Scopulibacillus darangshiensis TaxID=442528 RepID=A0A4R2P4T6_9BACL|nr:hypothetical protein [Scopulibacillus darangshiensis]TCP29830.1 hypothetical protein EV207_108124 [Scopulibacillus darangshiensis]